MSADNWEICPFCVKKRLEGLARREAAVADAYGTVPVDQFDALRAELEKDRSTPLERTFREDYEIGLLDTSVGRADFFVRYKGRCSVCNYSHEFRHDDELAVGDGAQDDLDAVSSG